MDGDIDVPGADAEDTDGDMADTSAQVDNGDGVEDLVARLMAAVRKESAEDPHALLAEAMGTHAVTEAAPDPAPEAAAEPQGKEPAVSEAPTTEAVAPATFNQTDLNAAVAQALAAEKAARKARKQGARPPAESAPAAPVAETEDERITRIVQERIAAASPVAVTETEEDRISRLVDERLTAAKQGLMESGGGPSRKGLVAEHSAAAASGEVAADLPLKNGVALPMEEWTDTQRRAVGRELERHVLGSRASQ
jgi:hypothetical protein